MVKIYFDINAFSAKKLLFDNNIPGTVVINKNLGNSQCSDSFHSFDADNYG